MYSIRHNTYATVQLVANRHARYAAAAFLPHSAQTAASVTSRSCTVRPRSTVCIPCSHRSFHCTSIVRNSNEPITVASTPIVDDATSVVPETDANTSQPPAADSSNADIVSAPPAKKSKWKIFPTVSARRKDFEQRIAAATVEAEEEERLERERQELEEQERIAREEEEALKAQIAAGGITDGAPELSSSQVRGILAKRAALQALHPLRMLLTSPRQGLDRIRVLPTTLQRRIDNILKTANFIAGQNDVLQRTDYPLWHVANRSAFEFAVLTRIFDEMVKRLPSLDPYSMLDYGAATSMSFLALQEAIHNYGNKDSAGHIKRPLRTYRVIENNAGLAKYGTQLTEEAVRAEGVEVKYRSTLPSLPAAGAQPLELSSVVIAPFSLGLLDQQDRRHKALDVLWSSVAPDGVLVLVEGGTIESFEVVRQAREYLLDQYGMRSMAQKATGDKSIAANVFAPCASNGVCPLGDKKLKQSCWHRTELLTSSLPLRTPQKHLRSKDGVTVETFSYLVLHKGPIHTNVLDAKEALIKWIPKEKDLLEIGQQGWQAVARKQSFEMQETMQMGEAEAGEGGDATNDPSVPTAVAIDPLAIAAVTPAEPTTPLPPPTLAVDPMSLATTKRTDLTPIAHLLPSRDVPANIMFDHAYSRILRKPLKRGEHVILDLCNEESKLERRIIAKSWGIPYTLARMVGEGDLWAIKKRARGENEPMSLTQKRKAEFKERKEKRKAKLEGLDEEEATLLKQEHNARKAAEKAARQKARDEHYQAKKDALIIARGGTVPDRSKKDPSKSDLQRDEPEDILFVDEGDLSEAQEAELAKFKLPSSKTGKLWESNTTTEMDGEQAAELVDPTADGTAKPKKAKSAKKSKPTIKTPLGEETLSSTGGLSRMPAWMQPIMKQTRKATGGGLEYTGTQLPRSRDRQEDDRDDDNEDEEDSEGEFIFPQDPSIQAAAKLSDPSSSSQSPEELERLAAIAQEKALARKLSEKQRREKSPLATKRQLDLTEEEKSSMPDLADEKPREKRQPKDVKVPKTKEMKVPKESNQSKHARPVKSHASTLQPDTSRSLASKPPLPHSTVVDRVSPADLAASVDTPAAATAAAASPSLTPSHATTPGTVNGVSGRLPKWAKFRSIKRTEAVAATPENTAAWPADSKDARRNTLATSDAEWEAIEAAERKKQQSSAVSFFKREEARRQKGEAAGTAATGAPSTLPPHLAALKAAALKSPANAQFASHREKVNKAREKFQDDARERSRSPRPNNQRSHRNENSNRNTRQHARGRQ